MTYLVTYTSPWSPKPQQCEWVCRDPANKLHALESFKANNTSATVLDIAERPGWEVDE